ncbi:hypothetical protein DRF67_11215 [Chryseobacterium pennipullorum]|uniref:Uncharacterized protein n=1 Tax=Chryseobacterium pennipullorum TaxID=2258963 RepID=A0A3D9B1I9_9FLAO|nr:hypothetical protein DRF67_11215 [Chryseobacterium pennipullorum]
MPINEITNTFNSLNSKIKIDDEDYLEIKTDCKGQIEKLEAKLTKGKDNKKIDFQKLLDQALSNLVDLAKVYTDGDMDIKRKIIGSIFPEKLQFFKNHYRTTRSNVLLSYMCQINNELGAKKNRK